MKYILVVYEPGNRREVNRATKVFQQAKWWWSYVRNFWILVDHPLDIEQLNDELKSIFRGYFICIQVSHLDQLGGQLPADAWPSLEELLNAQAGSYRNGSGPDAETPHSRTNYHRSTGPRPPGPDVEAPRAGWWHVFGFTSIHEATLKEAESRWRQRVHQAHPDRGGSDEAMRLFNDAIAQAREYFGKT